MFMIRLENIPLLLNATSLLTQFANEAYLKFSPVTFSIIARPLFPRFVAMMFMPHQLFANYSVDGNHLSKISLQSFHNALLEGQNFSSMTIHLLEHQNRLILRFEASRHMAPLRDELALSPADDFVVGQLSLTKFFSIDSEEFIRIISAVSVYHDHTISVTITSSHVRFSVASKEITLSNERGQCLILGNGEDEVQLLITLHPTSFFLNLANQARTVWFFQTTDSRSAINVPFQDAKYLVYFPQMSHGKI